MNLTLEFYFQIMAEDFECTYILQLKGNKLIDRINKNIDNTRTVTPAIAPNISLLPLYSEYGLVEISRIIARIDQYNLTKIQIPYTKLIFVLFEISFNPSGPGFFS